MRRLCLLLAIAAPGCAFADPAAADALVKVDITLQAKKGHEECARLEPGQARRYHWKADAPVDFNIHYHRGEEVFFPIKRDAMRGDGGTFTAKSGEDYCWMWTARDKGARVQGRIEK